MAEYFALVPRKPPVPGLRPTPSPREAGAAAASPTPRVPSLVRAVELGVAGVFFAFPLRIGACGRARLRMSVSLVSNDESTGLGPEQLQAVAGLLHFLPPVSAFSLRGGVAKKLFLVAALREARYEVRGETKMPRWNNGPVQGHCQNCYAVWGMGSFLSA